MLITVARAMCQQRTKPNFNHSSRVVTLVAEKQWLCIVYFANCIRHWRGRFSDYLTIRILLLAKHICMGKVTPGLYQKACNSNHDHQYMRESLCSFYQKHHILVNRCSEGCPLHVSYDFGIRFLMACNWPKLSSHHGCLFSLSTTRVTTQWL